MHHLALIFIKTKFMIVKAYNFLFNLMTYLDMNIALDNVSIMYLNIT